MSLRFPKLHPAAFRALETASTTRVQSRRALGRYAAIRALLLKHHYISPFNEQITEAGRAALAAWKARQS